MKRIAVVGDIMVDEYRSGSVTRVSPEAPIPVVKTDGSVRYVPGGCGNVANNLVSLECPVTVFSVCGKDADGEKLCEALQNQNIEWINGNRLGTHRTIVKQRIVGNGQQIVRIDNNDEIVLSAADEAFLVETFGSRAKEFGIVVISDYGKGVCTDFVCTSVIKICRNHGIPVVIDPKGIHWKKYTGAYLITPNVKEISEFAGAAVQNEDAAIEELGKQVYSKIGIENLLITRSEKGMTLFAKDHRIWHYSSQAKEVFDVSGAGDTVVAAICAWLYEHTEDLLNAIPFANAAAGIVVGKAGTSTVTKKEIDRELRFSEDTAPVFRVDELEAALDLICEWKEQGKTVVTTNGCFDVLHKGHALLLKTAKQLGDKLVVCINSDASVKRLKGADRPVNSSADRAFLLSAMRFVDAVIVFDERIQGTSNSDAPIAVIQKIAPDIHVKGGDYTEDKVPEAKFAGRFVAVPFVEGYSTTKTLKKEAEIRSK